MPKKKKSSQKEDKILAEIAETLKKVPARKEDSELEEDTISEEDTKSFDDALSGMDFHQFMRISNTDESGSPVLERVALEAPKPIFVSQFQGARVSQAEADESAKNDGFKYIGGGQGNSEAKYIDSSIQIYKEPGFVDINEAGRKQTPIGQETFFNQSAEASLGTQQNGRERTWRVDRFEVENAGRKNPFEREREEKKYEKYKPSHSN